MSPRAAWRLEALGFEHVYDYAAGKVDWLAHGLPREGSNAVVPFAGELIDPDPVICRPRDRLDALRAALERSRHGFLLVVNDHRILVGRVRRSALEHADPDVTGEELMEPGPTTIRPNTPARELVERLGRRKLATAIVTDPEGRLLGVFARADAAHRLRLP
jgi:CBS domain-containing protein